MSSNPFIRESSAVATLQLAKRLALVVVVFGALAACAGDDSTYQPPPPSQSYRYTCTASITPSYFDYAVKGDVLEVIAPGQSEQYQRVASGDPGNPVFGTWHLATLTDDVGTVTLDMEIGPDRVTAIADCDFGSVSTIAEASSLAVITDTSVTILDSAEDVEVVYGD
jgi:hypothetical protein